MFHATAERQRYLSDVDVITSATKSIHMCIRANLWKMPRFRVSATFFYNNHEMHKFMHSILSQLTSMSSRLHIPDIFIYFC